MTDEQITVDKLKNDVACKENIINHLAEHNIKLQAQLKCKELECEGWKTRSDGWMSKCEQETKLREFVNEQLDQEQADSKKLKQTLADIKDIAERETDSKEFMAIQCMLNGSVDDKNKVLKQILQKISECEVKNDR